MVLHVPEKTCTSERWCRIRRGVSQLLAAAASVGYQTAERHGTGQAPTRTTAVAVPPPGSRPAAPRHSYDVTGRISRDRFFSAVHAPVGDAFEAPKPYWLVRSTG